MSETGKHDVDADSPSFTPEDSRALRAVAVQFFVNGALFASFIPRLPEIRDRIGSSVAGIGLLLSIAGIAGLVGSVAAGPMIGRYQTRRVMLGAGTLVSLSLALVGLATSPIVLLIGLAGMLTFDVFVDVAMNMQGSWLSARRHAPVMNRLHGLWSLGAVIGGLLSSRIAAAGVSISVHLVGAGVVLFAVLGYVSGGLLRVDEHHGDDGNSVTGTAHERQGRDVGRILALFVLAGFFAVALESSSIEWAAFRFSDDLGASAGFAAFGYVAVTAGITIGRFAGDSMTTRVGTRRVSHLAVALTGIGLAAATLSPSRYLALGGYVIAGLGIATMLPMLYDTAARHPGSTGTGLGALTAGIRFAGITIPVLVGTLAATTFSVGSAIAIVTLPSAIGYLLVTAQLARRGELPAR